MKITFYILSAVFLFTSCSNKPEFIYLCKLSGKQIINFNREYGFCEHILINNSPKNIDSTKQITYEYFLCHGKDLCSFDSTISDYGITFYRKTSNTSYFIDNAEDPGGLFSKEIINYPEDRLITYSFQRSKQNPHIWIASLPEDMRGDTIKVCE